MPELTFDEVLSRLASCSTPPTLVDPSVGIAIPTERSDTFVAPCVGCAAVPTGSQVLLVSAPAAVGKTTLAWELAAAARAPLWDLASTQVGSNTFVGGLVRAFGAGALPDVLNGLRTGSFLLVVDALDEAHLRSGYQNFEAFIADLAEAIRGTSARVTVVMLARVETSVLTELLLISHGVSLASARIDYFDEESARHLIDSRLVNHWRSMAREPQHRRNPLVLRQAVDRLFDFVASCFGVDAESAWMNEQVRRFLGYAPVLQAIADYLAVDNLQVVLNELADATTGVNPNQDAAWNFLIRVVDSVIARERMKVLPPVQSALSVDAEDLGWSDWDSLYAADEQIDRVLRRFFRIGLFSDRTPILPIGLRDGYEKCLEPVADQHPFLTDSRGFANLVFEEYALAWALASGSGAVRDHAQRSLMSGAHLPNPLLGRFPLGLAPTDESSAPIVDGEHVGLLFDAFSSAAERSGEIVLWLVTSDIDGTRGRILSGSDEGESIPFRIGDSGHPVQFWRRLARADVLVDGGVVLGLPGQPFVLGPDVDLETDLIETPASEYVVLGEEDSYVYLSAQSHVDTPQPTSLKVYSDGTFGVKWDPLVHPWYGYQLPTDDSLSASPAVLDAFDDLVRIVRPFRRHGRDELARKKELIDNVAVGRSTSERTVDARRLLGYLLENGVLRDSRESRGLYILELSALGMSWADVREHRMTEAARGFLQGFVSASL